MEDEVLNKFVRELLSLNIVSDKFEQHIEMFSKFLGYTNPEYKYNGTYLSQYVSDFILLYETLRKKDKVYQEIFFALIFLKYNYELVADQTFHGYISFQGDTLLNYIGINKGKILSKGVEVRIKIEAGDDEYVFCKEYENYEEEKLPEKIRDEVKQYIKLRRKKK